MTIPYQPSTYYGCSHVTESYKPLGKIGEGTFGEVFRAEQIASKRHVALKKILLHSEKEGFPVTALREIRILKLLRHENVIPLVDLAVERGDQSKKERGCVYMVTPYMDHDLAGLLGNQSVQLSPAHIKCYMLQLLEGIGYLHAKKFLHRDIKAANILVNDQGILKLADFGLARGYDGPAPTAKSAGINSDNLTAMVVTRWYRPPELILGDRKYTTAIDMWGIGCVFGEFFTRKPIFPGASDIDQGAKIFQAVGVPTEETMPGWSVLPGAQNSNIWGTDATNKLDKLFGRLSKDGLDFLKGLLLLDPTKRLTAIGGKNHAYFKTEPLPCLPHELPKWQSSHELDNHKRREQEKNEPKPKPAPVREVRERDVRERSRDSRDGRDRESRPPRDSRDRDRDRDSRDRDRDRDRPPRGPPRGRHDSAFERPERRPEGPRDEYPRDRDLPPRDRDLLPPRDRERERDLIPRELPPRDRDYPPPRDWDRRPPPRDRDYPPRESRDRDYPPRDYPPPRDRDRDRDYPPRGRPISPSRERFHKRPQFDMYSDTDYDRDDDDRRRRPLPRETSRDVYVPSRGRDREPRELPKGPPPAPGDREGDRRDSDKSRDEKPRDEKDNGVTRDEKPRESEKDNGVSRDSERAPAPPPGPPLPADGPPPPPSSNPPRPSETYGGSRPPWRRDSRDTRDSRDRDGRDGRDGREGRDSRDRDRRMSSSRYPRDEFDEYGRKRPRVER